MMKEVGFYVYIVLLCYLYLFEFTEGGDAVKESESYGSVKLFVFGDSYADTGNWDKSAISWKEPYGITFPGSPSGRFSDGRILTDYIASFLGIKTPISYGRWKESRNRKESEFGMNFAYGGTGVFDTLNKGPNMATQIDYFQQLIKENVYTKQDLNSSIALVSVAGNDYGTFLQNHTDLKALPNYTESVINQLSKDLQRMKDLGVKKVAVTGLQPIGCLPAYTASSSYKNCSETWNEASNFHNQKLQQAVEKLNNQTHKPVFQILDLFSSFMLAFNQTHNLTESSFVPCCRGSTSAFSCGGIEKNGSKEYVICKKPELSIFWDVVHPSQNGWRQVYLALKSSLHKLY